MATLTPSNADGDNPDLSTPEKVNWKKKFEKERKDKKAALKQLDSYKSKLKKAKIDIEKASNYYRKQTDIFKTKQNELLKHISSTNYSSKKKETKLVFVEDMKQITISEKGPDSAIDVVFANGEQATFHNIHVIDTTPTDNAADSAAAPIALKPIETSPSTTTTSTTTSKQPSNANNGKNGNNGSEAVDHTLQNILFMELEKRVEDISNLINITFVQKDMINDKTDDDEDIDGVNDKNDDISLQMRLNLIETVNQIKIRHNRYNLYHKSQRAGKSPIGSTTPPKKLSIPDKENSPQKYGNNSNSNTSNAKNKKRASTKAKAATKMEVEEEKRMEIDSSSSTPNKQLLSANPLQQLHENNALWRNLLLNFPIDIVGILAFELNDRIHDLQNVKDVLYKNKEALYDSIHDIMVDIKSRHRESFRSWQKTTNTHSMTQKWKHVIGEMALNNARWRKQIEFDLSSFSKTRRPRAQTISVDENNQRQKGRMDARSSRTVNKAEMSMNGDGNIRRSDSDKAIKSKLLRSRKWLFGDQLRNEFLDSLKVNQHSVNLLTYIGAYLNRIVPTSRDLQENVKLQALYTPIITSDPRNVIMSCLDGVVFAVLLNLVTPHSIDLRALQLPSLTKPKPLSELQIAENFKVIFSTLHSLNIQLPHWEIDDYFDTNNTVNIILSIVFQLFYKMMDHKINIASHPELIRLCQNDAERDSASYVTFRRWINKWLLHLKEPKSIPLQSVHSPRGGTTRNGLRSGHQSADFEFVSSSNALNASSSPSPSKSMSALIEKEKKESNDASSVASGSPSPPDIAAYHQVFDTDADLIRHVLHTVDYHDYLILICCRMDKQFLTEKLPQIHARRKNSSDGGTAAGGGGGGGGGDDDVLTSKLLLECIVNAIGTNTIVEMEDIASRNPLLQQLLLSDIFEANNNIDPLNTTEKRRVSQIVHVPNKSELAMVARINSFFGDTKLHITDLQYSLSDGVIILKLLDKLKSGCVDWKAVKQKDQVRHKTDKLINCKLIMDICLDKFGFNLVGMNSTDITDGNLKYVLNLLSQIMWYHSTRFISEIQFNGKAVTDKMILQWTNNRIRQYKKSLADKDKEKENKFKLNTIKSFREAQLNDSILFLNLLSSIHEEWVNYDLVEVAPSGKEQNSKQQQNHYKLANAKYGITIIRKLGCKIFHSPSDICDGDEKAILWVITCIMIIAARHSQTDHLLK